MKFFKAYKNHIEERAKTLPEIGFKSMKRTLKNCKTHVQSQNSPECPVCDRIFFPLLLDDMSTIVDCFDGRAQELLDPPLVAGIWKYYCLGCKGKEVQMNDAALIKEGQDLLIYAMVNAIAFRKILKKYDKVHNCEKGQAFKSGTQAKHIDILRSPWLCELMAFHINLRDTKLKSGNEDPLFEGLVLAFDDDKLLMSCELFDSIKIDFDLTCSICLDVVFDAVALTCGHILCYMCACSAASVTIVDGLKVAAPMEKCPLCRKVRVYGGAIHLEELNMLLSRKCPEYWEKRLESERMERLSLVKEHWQSLSRAFVGV